MYCGRQAAVPSTTGTINGQRAQADQKFEMKFADVVDELMFAGSAPGDDQNDRAFHCTRTRSASTSRASFSRPWEATRM